MVIVKMAAEEIAIIVFTLGFLGYWAIWLSKLYNVMTRARTFDVQIIVLSFIGILLAFGFSVISMLAYPSTLLSTLVLSQAFTLPGALIFFTIEVLLRSDEIKAMSKDVFKIK